MIPKIILPSSFGFDEPIAKMMDVCAKGVDKTWLEKRAAMFDDRMTEIRPKAGHSYVHVITTGAGERYGSNSNGDFYNKEACEFEIPFPRKKGLRKLALEGGLKKYHSTYTKGAGVYRNHADNRDLDKAHGKIAAEAYNDRMERGELVLELDNGKWAAELEKIAKNEPLCWSQGSVVAHDWCSACGHKRKTRQESCDHIANHPLEILKTGHQIFAINDKPTFHDISCVFRPADKIAFALRKMDLAKAAGSVIRSDELAELMGWLPGPSAKADTGKLALLRKLAAMEAELDKAAGEQWFEDLKLARALDPDIGMLKRACAMCGGMAQGLSGMSNLKITLPLPVFLKLIMGDTLDESHAACASRRGPSLFRDMLQAPDLPDILGDGDYEVAAPLGASRSLEGLREGFSLEPGPARRRIMIAVIRGVRKPEGKAPPADDVEKAAAETAGLVMAREYGKYLLASLKDQDDQVRRMALAQNRAP